MNVRHYPPISLGAFQDMLDELRGANWNVENVSTHSARVASTSGATKFKLVTDEDGLRAQLLAGDDTPGTWKPLETVVSHYASVSGEEKTRWDKLAGELAALDAVSVHGTWKDIANGDEGELVAGEPKTKTFSLTPDEVQRLLDGARAKGFDVTKTGDNAYSIDTHTAGVKLAASYDTSSQTATITITNSDFYVSNAKVWEKLQPLMPQHVAAAAADASATPTPAATDAEGHVSYLETAEQKIRNAWDKVKDLDDAAKKKTREKAKEALDTAKDLAKDVEQGLRATGGAVHVRAVAVKNKLIDTAKEIVPWYLAIGIGTWVVIGGVLYLAFNSAKSGDTQRRYDSQRETVVRGARSAGVAI